MGQWRGLCDLLRLDASTKGVSRQQFWLLFFRIEIARGLQRVASSQLKNVLPRLVRWDVANFIPFPPFLMQWHGLCVWLSFIVLPFLLRNMIFLGCAEVFVSQLLWLWPRLFSVISWVATYYCTRLGVLFLASFLSWLAVCLPRFVELFFFSGFRYFF